MIKIVVKYISVLIFGVLLAACSGIQVNTFDSFGSYPKWLFGPSGHYYKSVGYRWDYEKYALVYIYRPVSEWAMDEVEAPSFNLNDKRLFNIKGGGYTWYELEPGNYDVVVRRGIFGIERIGIPLSKTYSDFTMSVEAGKVYYLRYSEIDPAGVAAADNTGSSRGDGPLQLVGHDMAVREMEDTKLIHHGREIVLAKADSGQGTSPIDESSDQSNIPQQYIESSAQPSFNQDVPSGKETEDNASEPEQQDIPVQEKKVDWWPF